MNKKFGIFLKACVQNIVGGAKSMNKNSKIAKFISGKGFYVALAVCLIGAGVASWIAVDRTLSGLENDLPDTASNVGFFETSGSTDDVGKHSSNVQKDPSKKPSAPSVQPSGSTTSTDAAAQAEPSQTQQKQYFMLPVSGEIQQEYSNRELVKSVTMGDWRTHNGVDIACEVNTTVRCFSDGVVTEIVEDKLWGTTVKMEHPNGYVSVYCGLSPELSVEEGQKVEIGDVIGTTANSSAIEIAQEPHLHFEVIKNGTTVDPIKLISGK